MAGQWPKLPTRLKEKARAMPGAKSGEIIDRTTLKGHISLYGDI